jgi:hypothetical protein
MSHPHTAAPVDPGAEQETAAPHLRARGTEMGCFEWSIEHSLRNAQAFLPILTYV